MKLQEFLLVLFCTIAVTLSASVLRQRREGNSLLAAEEEFLQLSRNVVRVTREAAADDDYDTDDDESEEDAESKESPSGIFESFNTILAAAMDMIRNIITIKQNIVIPLSTAAVRTVDTLVNSELTQTVIDTKVNLARTALGVGPKLLDTAVTIAQRKAAVFQLAVCKLFCPLTGGSDDGIKQCQAQHCPKEEEEESAKRQAKSKSDDGSDADVVEVESDVEVFAKLEDADDEGRNKRKAKAKEELQSIEAEIDADEKELKRKLLKWKKIMAELEEEEE